MSKPSNSIPILKSFYKSSKTGIQEKTIDLSVQDSIGTPINAFEEELEEYLGNNTYVAALNSGTSAIHLALILLGVTQGDEVLCQSLTFSASANPIMYQGAKPVFVDSESLTWNISPFYLEEAIHARIALGVKPKAIIAVHSYGMPYQADAIRQISDRYDIPVIEDSAEALGSRYKGEKCGNLGAISIYSFNNNKIVTTMGGGALISNDINHKKRAIFLATQAKDEAPHYQHSTVGYNYRMSSLCAQFGLGQIDDLTKRVESNRSMHVFYSEIFADINGVTVFTEPSIDYYSNYWLVVILVDPLYTGGIAKSHLQLALKEAGVESRPIWKPMHLQPVFDKMPYYGEDVSKELFDRGLCLPSGIHISEEERAYIKSIIKRTFV